jgi:HK97 gp10 family phage protein
MTDKPWKVDTRRLNEILMKIAPGRQKIIRETAFVIEARAKVDAPVKTGALRSSLHVDVINDMLCRVQDGVEYGIYQELGTSKMAAQPFLVPAVEAERKYLAEKYKELFK